MPRSCAPVLVHEDRLAWCHAGETHRLAADLQRTVLLRDDNERRPGQNAGVRVILTKMRAARILACQRRRGDDTAHRDQAAQVQPVVPAQVEAAVAVGHTGTRQPCVQCIERTQCALQTRRVAQDAHVLPQQPSMNWGLSSPNSLSIRCATPCS